MRCKKCQLRIRGENHKKGKHHKERLTKEQLEEEMSELL